jgi:hypothetical protein
MTHDGLKIYRTLAKMLISLQLCVALVSGTPWRLAAAEPSQWDAVKLNQLQVIGTHNSYHVRLPVQPGSKPPRREVAEWNYSHAPLDVQLDRGVRSFELDLHYKDGTFAVFHVPLADEGSTCPLLTDALTTVRKWSDAHPEHVPISFLFELKAEGPLLDRRIKEVDAAGLDKLDEVLCAAFPAERRITPDDVRGEAGTLREAVQQGHWPTLQRSRGRVFFILHDEGKKRDLYVRDHSSLRGRAMFVRSDELRDDAATLVMDNPRDPRIPSLVEAGYYIRTRADSSLRADSRERRDAALASGAQILSTDYPAGEPQADTGYTVELPAPARVNPVNGPTSLRGQPVGR